MLKRLPFILVLVLLVPAVLGLGKAIDGYVFDYQNEPAEGVNVTLVVTTNYGYNCSTYCSLSASDGHYTCNLGNLKNLSGNLCADYWSNNDSMDVFLDGSSIIPEHYNTTINTFISSDDTQLLDNVTLELIPNNINLTSATLSPLNGNETTNFNFTINYINSENNPPEYINLTINNSDYEMIESNPSDTTYSDGKTYYYNSSLNIGTYSYRFIASDGEDEYQTLLFSGPNVEDSTSPSIVEQNIFNEDEDIGVNIEIELTFNELLDEISLTNSNIILQDEDGEKVSYELDFDNDNYLLTLTPNTRLKFKTDYTLTLQNINDTNGNVMSQNIIIFETENKDTDGDDIDDDSDDDDDGDGVDDEDDPINGDASDIRSNLNIIVDVDGDTTINQDYSGNKKVTIRSSSTPYIEFDIDFDSDSIDLADVSIFDESNSSFGRLVIHGLTLPSGVTKTVYLKRSNTSLGGVCVRDRVTASVDTISSSCSGSGETKVECDGTLQGGYTCSYNSTIAMYKITGLTHSAIKQINYEKPDDTGDEEVVEDTEESSAAGGGGGGGGGSSASRSSRNTVTTQTQQTLEGVTECYDSSECLASEQCLSSRCIPIVCEGGAIVNHKCVYETCEVDLDCADGVCLDGACVECIEDFDCGEGQFCRENMCIVTADSMVVDAPKSVRYGGEIIITIEDLEGKPLQGIVLTTSQDDYIEQHISDEKGVIKFRLLSEETITYKIEVEGEIITGEIQVRQRLSLNTLLGVIFGIVIFILLTLLIFKGKQHDNFGTLKKNFISGVKGLHQNSLDKISQMKKNAELRKRKKLDVEERKRLEEMDAQKRKEELFKKEIKQKQDNKEFHDLLEDEDLSELK